MNEVFPLLVANHKANKNWQEVDYWLKQVSRAAEEFHGTVVVCPSYPFIAAAARQIETEAYKIKLGVQDISKFGQGAYTGEVSAPQVKDLVEYAIIGHSERRTNFQEDEDSLADKVKNAQASDIEVIFCVQNDEVQIPKDVKIIAYEPTFAIGTGEPDSVENIAKVAMKIKEKHSGLVIYGGSVSNHNAKSIIDSGNVDGLLVGATNSLDPEKFNTIIKAL